VCDLETSRMGAPYIYDISRLRVKRRWEGTDWLPLYQDGDKWQTRTVVNVSVSLNV